MTLTPAQSAELMARLDTREAQERVRHEAAKATIAKLKEAVQADCEHDWTAGVIVYDPRTLFQICKACRLVRRERVNP